MGYSIDSLTSDCYEESSVLINKFDIRDIFKENICKINIDENTN